MTEKQESQEPISRFKKDIEILKNKIIQAGKNKSEDKSVTIKRRLWKKSIKRAQRKIRFLTGKKLSAKKSAGTEDKKTAAAAPAAQA